MSRGRMLALLAAGAAMATAAGAQTARTSPDQVICAMTGDCTAAAPTVAPDDASPRGQPRVGQTRSFSLVKPSTMAPAQMPTAQPAAPAKRVATVEAAGRRRAPAPRPASGRLDILVTFATGSADLDGAGRQELQSFATAMASPALASMRFNVEGHTDAVGQRAYNLELSKRRADAVVAYLTSLGVDSERLRAQGFGFDRPRPGLAPRAAGNRRVEFVKGS